jgi:hypothetical protein
MTDLSDAAKRAHFIATAIAAADAVPNAERMRLPWRSSDLYATVVELPVDMLLLNPRSHRIRAQLESSQHRALIEAEPFSDDAQGAIASILQEAEEFDGLRKNLADAGQIEAGLVTADGMLVNANTRCVALRANKANYIRVAVLPADASPEEIDRIELRLQMKRDFRSDYTFTNELLFIDDLIVKYGHSPEEITVEMGWAAKTDPKLSRKAELSRSYARMLALIREVQKLSGGRIPIVEFDATRQALMELDEEYERLKHSDPSAARELRDARLVGLLAEAGYRPLREIGADFLDKFLVPAMEDSPQLEPHVEALTRSAEWQPSQLPGLDILEDEPPAATAGRRSSRALMERSAGTLGHDIVSLATADGPPREVPRSLFCAELLIAIQGAAEDAKLEREVGDRLNRPRELVRKASKFTQAAMEAYREVADSPDFDLDRLVTAIADLGAAREAFVKLIDDEGSAG